jgi:nitric oxide dioxygenase
MPKGPSAGEVSNWIRNVVVGDLLDVAVPFGDLPTPGSAPVVLISAGIISDDRAARIPPAQAPDTDVQVLHADRTEATHPLRERQRELVDALPCASLEVWYEYNRGLLNPTTSRCPRAPRCTCAGTTDSCRPSVHS